MNLKNFEFEKPLVQSIILNLLKTVLVPLILHLLTQ